MKRALFVCSQNKLRSPTAEAVFVSWSGVETDSGGIFDSAEVPVSSDQIEWADLIFVMEKIHRRHLQRRFQKFLKNKRIICLDIPDRFAFMDPALVSLLESKAGPYLR